MSVGEAITRDLPAVLEKAEAPAVFQFNVLLAHVDVSADHEAEDNGSPSIPYPIIDVSGRSRSVNVSLAQFQTRALSHWTFVVFPDDT